MAGQSAGAAAAQLTDALQGGVHPPAANEEATSMTVTESTPISLEGLLGTVGEAMTGEVVVLQADTPADVATWRLEHMQVSGAPVVDHGRVVGVVTLRDLLVPVLADGSVQTTGPFHRHEHRLTGYRVHELMTAEPVTARVDSPLAKAVLSMDQVGINRLPVVNAGGRPVGILTRDDVLRALARRIRQLGRPEGGRPEMEPD
jgi:CBS domain-containing protein